MGRGGGGGARGSGETKHPQEVHLRALDEAERRLQDAEASGAAERGDRKSCSPVGVATNNEKEVAPAASRNSEMTRW